MPFWLKIDQSTSLDLFQLPPPPPPPWFIAGVGAPHMRSSLPMTVARGSISADPVDFALGGNVFRWSCALLVVFDLDV